MRGAPLIRMLYVYGTCYSRDLKDRHNSNFRCVCRISHPPTLLEQNMTLSVSTTLRFTVPAVEWQLLSQQSADPTTYIPTNMYHMLKQSALLIPYCIHGSYTYMWQTRADHTTLGMNCGLRKWTILVAVTLREHTSTFFHRVFVLRHQAKHHEEVSLILQSFCLYMYWGTYSIPESLLTETHTLFADTNLTLAISTINRRGFFTDLRGQGPP